MRLKQLHKIKSMEKFTKKLNTLIACLLTCTLILSSCTKNTYDKIANFEMDPAYSIGLIKGTVGFSNLNNMLSDNNSVLKIGSDSSMTFYWNGNISTFHTVDFIPAISASPVVFSLDQANKILMQYATTTSPVTITQSQTLKITPLKASKIDIDSILLKSGMVQIVVTNKFNEPCTMLVTLPDVKQNNGTPFTTTFTVKPNTTTIDSFDISNKWIDMSRGGTTSNSILVNYSITFSTPKSAVEPNGDLSFIQEVKHPEMKLLYGDIHQQNFFDAYVSDIPLNIFKIKQQIGNTIKFTKDTINIRCTNTFGVPLSCVINEIKSIDANHQNHYLNVGGISPTPFIIPAANGLSDVAHSLLSLNGTNPPLNGSLLDISGFLGTLPTVISPRFTVISNAGSKTKNNNFIKDTSSGKIDAEIIIPLNLSINNFVTKDTFDFSFGEIANIDSFSLRVALNNGIPLGISASLDFVDAQYNVIYHFEDKDKDKHPILRPALVDNSNKVIGKTLTITDFTIGQKVVPLLKNVTKLVFTGTLSSPSSGSKPAILYANQTMDINIGAKAYVKIN